MEKWQNKNAIITGASSGIGAQVVRDLAKAGINVVALARRIDKLEDLKNELKDAKGKVYAMKCDVSDKKSIDSAFKEIAEKIGLISILVNNAGIVRNCDILDKNDAAGDSIEEVVKTNLIGLLNCSRKAYQSMIHADDYGIIINISSIVGHSVPFVPYNFNVYPGTKHAVRASTEVMRQELVKQNNKKIRVSEISPGAVETEIQNSGGFASTGETFIEALDFPALKPNAISDAVLFLLSTPYSVNITELIIKPVGEKL